MAKISKKSDLLINISGSGASGDHQSGGGPPDFSGMEPITHIPNIDMFSTAEVLTIEVELPGVRKEDLELALVKNTLRLTALKFECFENNKVNYVCMERNFGRLYRTLDLPFPVDTSRIKAVYKDGILTITMPRVEDKRARSRSVNIESK
ncbi:MAG: Hsp20/alpha crystallin family protein [Thermodesulfobacteriota bacterium]